MKALAVAALIALAQADAPKVVDVARGELIDVNGAHVGVTGGGWLCDEYWLGYARELASKRAQVRYYERDLPMYIAGIIGMGVALGYVLERWLPGFGALLFPRPP